MEKVPKKVLEIQQNKNKQERGAKSISFSQLSLYVSCPNRWYRAYILNEAPYEPSIHTVFGTSLHETLQKWLGILYNDSVKAFNEFNEGEFLLGRMKKNYVTDRKRTKEDFSNSQQLQEFYQDGLAILEYIKKHRKVFFSSKNEYLVGCEIPILYKLKEKFYFKGFIDVLTYNSTLDLWKIWDIKTSTHSWSQATKKDKNKTDQLLLYKHFLSKQFDIPLDKIEVEYFIVKRKIDEDAEFPNMRKRVQEFIPSHGKRSVARAVSNVTSFVSDVLDENSGYKTDVEYKTSPSESSCKWCVFKDTCKAFSTPKVSE